MNIIFDLGGVVFQWEPHQLAEHIYFNPIKQDLILTHLVGHQDWQELDRGVLDEQTVIQAAAVRSGLSESEIDSFISAVPESLTPIRETLDLIRELKGIGHSLYALSNMHQSSIVHLEKTYDFWNLFEARIISCRVHLIKPQVEIYQYLLDAYQLDAQGTIFIDDTVLNLQAAKQFGIKTIHFQNPEHCRQELGKLGCFNI